MTLYVSYTLLILTHSPNHKMQPQKMKNYSFIVMGWYNYPLQCCLLLLSIMFLMIYKKRLTKQFSIPTYH